MKLTKKDSNLIKGALRRVFSRSELRREVLAESRVSHYDPLRERVKKWSVCPVCSKFIPTYLMEVDHIIPLLEVGKTLEDYTWDEIIDRLWCDKSNLVAICKECHKAKSKKENSLRREMKRGKNEKG